ncbi:MAG: hypothetical protein DWQ05_14360 [Calditrichaeota bacterium]|nr:MAG: hypothetical protein DWQ05_14360 [Calditrichota bacterium]
MLKQTVKINFTIFILIFLFLTCSASAQVATVNLQHQVYPLLQKAETLQLFSSYSLRLLPLSRSQIRLILWEINEKKDQLSPADAQLAHQMLQEFSDPEPDVALTRDHDRHIYRLSEGETQFFFDLFGDQNFAFRRSDFGLKDNEISETTMGGELRGMFGRRLGFGAHAFNTMIRGANSQEQFDVNSGKISVQVGESAFTDQATGYLAGKFGRFHFLAGRDYLSWGSGLDDRLALGLSTQPMDLIRLNLDFRKLRFSYFHANLSGVATQRYLIGHRLDFLLSKRVQLALYETLVYGNRDREWSYLNPILPYHVMEHQLGDLDNNMLGGDLSLFLHPGLRAFLEIFVDDFSSDFALGTHWGNKIAIHSGFHWAAPFHFSEFEVKGTYTRIDPWFYTHNDSANVYSHYGESLGSKLGPNADRVRFRLYYQPHRDSRWELRYAFVRKGRGTITDQHTYEDDGRFKKFLHGTVEKNSEFGLGLRQQFIRDLFLGFDLTFRKWHNYALEKNRNGVERFGQFYLRFNY